MIRYAGYKLGKIRATDAVGGREMMLDEAIEHAKEVARTCNDSQCAADHIQLAEWLRQARGADKASRWYMSKIHELEAENAKLKKENADLARLANMLTKLVFETSRCPSTSCVDCEVYELCGECVYLQGLYGIDKDLACDADMR